LVKTINWVYEIMQDYKDVFMSFYREPLSGCLVVNQRKRHNWKTNSLFHWILEKRLNNKDFMLTSWAMITSKVIYKMAKHVAIINWNFWNLPIVPLLRTPLQGLLSNSRLRSYVDQSWSSDTIASSSGWLISRCLCFDSSFSCLCNHLWYCEPKFLFFFF
jgi:hypothetical protein